MSKKGLKTMLVCIVLLIGLVTLFACNKSDVADKDGQTKVIVKIQDEDGSIYKENVVFSDLFTLSLQKEGYTGRLYRDEDFLKPLTKDSKVKNGDTVYVKWTINSYTVTFMDGKTVLKTEKVQHGSAATAPEVPKKDGKTFKEWDKGFSTVTSDLTINAVYDVDKFTLMFINFDGTMVYTEEVEYGASIEDAYNNAVEKVDIEGPFEYDGWYEVGDETTTLLDENNLPEMPARNVTYKLKLKLTLSAIGDNTAITVPGGFTYGEKSATFTVSGDTHDGVNYEYEWTILKDGKEYKKQTTTSGSITIENPDAGTYVASVKVVASKEGCGSVENDFTAGETLIVSRANISGIEVKDFTMTYGDKTAKIEISGLQEGDVVTYGTDNTTFPLQNVDLSALDYGEHDYYVRVERGDNYNPYTSGKITVKIDKATVTATVTPDDDKLTYGDTLPSLTAKIGEETYTIESGKYELHFGYTKITGNVANNVGTYNIENVDISVLRAKYSAMNYNITVVPEGTITINEADLTVTVKLDKPVTYGDVLPVSYTFNGLTHLDTKEEFTVNIVTEYKTKSPARDYTLTAKVSGEKTKFYNITVNTVEFKVNKKPATITINKVDDIEYGDKVPDLSAKVEVKGVLDGDSLSYTLNPNYEVGNKPGDYTASVEYDENAEANKNYEITATGTKFKVGEKKLTIKLNNTPTVAIGKTYTVNAEHLEKIGLVAGDTVTGYVTITKDAAGVYNKAADFDTTHLDVTNAGCYVISYEMSVEFVEVKFAIDFADVTLTYDGKPHGVLVTAKEGTNYTITYGESAENCNLEESPKYTNAGAYPIYFKVVDNKTQAEHVGYVTLTISPAKVTVTVNDVTITYGETPAFSCTVTGFVNGETHSVEADYTVKTLSGEEINIGAGTDAGEYVISVSGRIASDNYTVTAVKPGKLTINKKSATVEWNIAESYVYNDGQTLPTATYDGNPATLKLTKDGEVVTEFKDAGTYTVTVADKNYDLTDSEKTIVIEKATYDDPALSLTGTYDPNKTLGNYTLSEGFTWVNPDEVPVCTKKKYDAIYNKDPANYNDKETKVTLDLQKATVTLAQDLFEFNYDDGASREISTTVRYNNIEVTEPYTLTFEKNMFSAAGTHKTTATLTADNFALSDNVVYVKVKGVKVGNTYYTIEDALDVAASGQTIFVLNDTAFATQEIAGVLYNDVKFKTVKTGVTLLLPFNENDTVGHIGAGEDGSPNYNATAALTGTAKLYRKLVIPEGIEVIVNGKLVVGAQTGKIDAGQRQNAVSGNYCEISLGGTITLNNAPLEVYGYIKGNGEIIANNSTVIENLYLSGWMGGKISAIRYIGNDKILAGTLMIEGELKIDKPTQFPFSQYELRSIEAKLVVNKGSKLQGYAKIATGAIATVRAQINEAWLTFVSSDANNVDSGLFRLVGNNSKIIKSMNGDRIKIDLFGEIKDGYTSISILVINRTVSMTSEKVFFPIDGRTDITLKNGATFTQSYMFKALPGATITVENGGTYNLNGQLIMYDKSFTDISTYPYPGASRGDAKLTVNGTMNVNGALGGNVTSDNAGTVAVEANATISGIHSAEGEGTMEVGLSVKFTFNDTCGVTKSLEFVNADNTTVAAATNKTYNYNNGTWQ